MPVQGPQSMASGMFNPMDFMGDINSGRGGYDFSGMQEGVDRMKKVPEYKASTYTPFNFMDEANKPKSVGDYGTSSDDEFNKTYGMAMNAASRPVLAQQRSRDQQMNQGFAGGRMDSAANAELQMKSNMNTGSQLSDVGANIGSQLAGRRMTQQETARDKMFNDKQVVRGQLMDSQRNQADDNFRGAGLTDSQSRFTSTNAMDQATQMFDRGAMMPALQNQLTTGFMNQTDMMNKWNTPTNANVPGSGQYGG